MALLPQSKEFPKFPDYWTFTMCFSKGIYFVTHEFAIFIRLISAEKYMTWKRAFIIQRETNYDKFHLHEDILGEIANLDGFSSFKFRYYHPTQLFIQGIKLRDYFHSDTIHTITYVVLLKVSIKLILNYTALMSNLKLILQIINPHSFLLLKNPIYCPLKVINIS